MRANFTAAHSTILILSLSKDEDRGRDGQTKLAISLASKRGLRGNSLVASP